MQYKPQQEEQPIGSPVSTRQILDALCGFLGLCDVDGTLVDTNEATLRLAGVSRDEVLGCPFWDTFWWSHDEGVQQELKSALANAARGEVVRFEPELRIKGGALIAIDVTFGPLRNSHGEITHILGFGLDVTDRKQAERTVRVSEHRLRQMAENIDAVFWVTDPVMERVEYVSPSFERIWGWPDSDLYQNSGLWLEAIVPEDRQRVTAAFASFSETMPIEQEYRILRKDGETRFIRDRGFTVRDSNGRVIRCTGIAEDVTELKQAEYDREMVEERLRQAIRCSQIGIFDHDHLTGTIHWSSELRQIIGWTSDGPVEVADYVALIHSDDRDSLVLDIQRAHCPDGDGLLDLDYRLIRAADGQVRWLKTRSQTFFTKVGDSRQAVRTIGAVADITEQRQIQVALRESVERYRRAERGTNDGLWEWNVVTGQDYYSPRWFEILGYEVGDINQTVHTFKTLIHPDDSAKVWSAVESHFETGSRFDVEMRLRRKNGEYIWIRSRGNAVRNDHGAPVLMSGFITDISEARQAAALLQSERNQLRQILDSLFGFVAVLTLDGDIVEINQTPLLLSGLARSEVVGRPFCDIGWLEPGTESNVQKAIESAANDSSVRFDIAAVFPGLGRRDVDVSFQPMRDPNEQITNVIAFGVDVTDREQARQSLRLSEARLLEAHRLAGLGAWEVDLASQESWWSEEQYRLNGVTPRTPVTQEFFLGLIHPDDRASFDDAMNDLFSRGSIENDYRLVQPDGTVRRMHGIATMETDAEGLPIRIRGTNQDVTEQFLIDETLRQNEARLKEAERIGKLGFLDWDLETKRLLVSDQTLQIYGLEKNSPEITLEEITGLLYPEDRETVEESLRNAAAGIARHEMEHRMVRPDGNVIFVRTTAELLYDKWNRPHRLFGTVLDITERKLAELQQRQSDLRLRLVLEKMTDGFFILDQDWRYVEINSAGAEFVHRTPEQLIGRRYLDEFPEAAGSAWEKAYRHVMQGGESLLVEDFYEPLGRWYEARVYPLSGGISCFFSDISERKRAAEALTESRNRLQEAQRISQLGSWDLDLRTGHLSWSPEIFRIFEIDPSAFEATYEGFLNAVHPEDRNSVNLAYSESLKNRSHYEITHRLLLGENRIKWVNERCETEFAPDGTPLRSRGTVQDVTDRVLIEESIRRSLREKETLLREVHHRVKNNLQIISSLLHFHAKKEGSERVRQVFREGQDRLRSMILVHEALHRSQDVSQINLASYIQSLADQLQQSMSWDGQSFQLEIDVHDVIVSAEIAQPCGMIVSELLNNAYKHAYRDSSGGPIFVRITKGPDSFRLLVSDEGCGLPADFNISQATTFGLQLVYNLAEQLGATLTQATSGGTTITLEIPTPNVAQSPA